MTRTAWVSGLCALLVGCAAAPEEAASGESAVAVAPAFSLEVSPRIAAAPATIDEAFVRREVAAAIALYAREVAVPTGPIAVVVDPPDCLRTGYDMDTRMVRFCDVADTPRLGTASADVIHHEVFHALLCQTQPSFCAEPIAPEPVALHEGLADYFAWVLAPDDAFGEGYYRDKPFVRPYRTPVCYSLVGGGHEKGNALASALVARGRRLEDVARVARGTELTLAALLGDAPDDPCFGAHPPAVERTVTGYPDSALERYRIRPGAPLTIDFEGNAAFEARYPDLAIRWEPAPDLFSITPDGPRSFRVDATGASGFDKVTALYVAGGQVVGGKNFYFQIARP